MFLLRDKSIRKPIFRIVILRPLFRQSIKKEFSLVNNQSKKPVNSKKSFTAVSTYYESSKKRVPRQTVPRNESSSNSSSP